VKCNLSEDYTIYIRYNLEKTFQSKLMYNDIIRFSDNIVYGKW